MAMAPLCPGAEPTPTPAPNEKIDLSPDAVRQGPGKHSNRIVTETAARITRPHRRV